ncbi:MAG: zinc ribbon domain-containing protein [Candidatus Nezhaarchaeales archaeon]
MPFRKAQFYILYKSMGYGSTPELVDAKNTSKAYLMCVADQKSRIDVSLSVRKCGFQVDRHLVAA